MPECLFYEEHAMIYL